MLSCKSRQVKNSLGSFETQHATDENGFRSILSEPCRPVTQTNMLDIDSRSSMNRTELSQSDNDYETNIPDDFEVDGNLENSGKNSSKFRDVLV